MPRTVLVIGNSDGIGAAVTRALIGRGDRVVGISRSPAPPGSAADHEVHDVAAPDFGACLERIVREKGPFDACVYCAGIGSELRPPDFSGEARVFEVNLTAMVRTVGVLVPVWLAAGRGHFVGLSSLADSVLNPGAPSYSASKAGFSNYLVAIGLRLRRQGIHVTNIRFGFVDTKMAKAPIKPLMMTPERAARHVLRCLDHKPLQLSAPKVAAAVLHAVRLVQAVRVWTI
jgi:NAD(P)-dependent dehydrogenase (short-subunit alcohol dehydrogenase family)